MSLRYVLIVDDEQAVRQMMSFWLNRRGFEVGEAADAESARLEIAKRRPDIVLIDWKLPVVSGLDLVRMLRAARTTERISIIMVTARVEELDRVTALDCGVDDYVTKPFSPRELLARINAVLRRASRPRNEPRLQEASLSVLDQVRRCILANDGAIRLGPTDIRLLEFFMANPDRVYTRAQLLEYVWGSSAEARTVDVQIRRLRKALEEFHYDRLIQTVRGTGYRFSTRLDELSALRVALAQEQVQAGRG